MKQAVVGHACPCPPLCGGGPPGASVTYLKLIGFAGVEFVLLLLRRVSDG